MRVRSFGWFLYAIMCGMRTSCSFRVNCRFRLVILAVALGPGALALGARADGTGWAERIDASFAIGSDRSVIGANDLGLVNGVCTFNGRIEDVARVQGLYAPPYFCTDFDLNLTFDGKALSATRYVWRPEVLTRSGACDGWRVESRLYPLAGKRGAIMAVACVNGGTAKRDLAVTLSASGACGRQERWGFSKPSLATGTRAGACPVRWSLGEPSAPARLAVAPGETNVFHVAFAIGAGAEAEATVAAALADPSAAIAAAVADWRARVARLADRMPEFRCSDARLEQLYNRSLLHLLLCTWRTDAFRLNPYFATGGMNGGCICCYLWNLGGPFRMLPLYDPEALKAHLDVLYALDLTKCYAFAPSDGSALGPYYMINQEKMINLVDAYVRETGDLGYLNETHAGKKVIAHVVDYALAHDDLAKEAVLVDYGSSNSHLELRRQYRYNGTMPDLNLRRIALLHQADALCRLARHDPKVDLTGRARALRRLVRKELWDPGAGWFRVRLADGKTDLRWTMQMFKTFGWGEKVLDRDVAAALLGHLMNPDEFLGSHGIHSLSKRDPAYDPADVDNGGPGACPSFPASVAERLFRDGHVAEAQGILSRLLWLGEKLPYWGDSQYADRADYRRDTPLQCDIEGACLAQTIVFGLFGVTIGDDLRVSANPHLPPGVEWMSLTNLRLAGKRYDFAVPSAGAAEAASDAVVEILDGAVWRPAGADAAWNGDELSVRAETPIFRTLVIRMSAGCHPVLR